jgi:predicted ATPase
MEDLHWVDPSTLELLSLLVDQGPTARILALFTFRPDFNPPWTGRSHLTQVTVHRLPRRQAVEMTGRVAHGKALPPEVVEQIVAKTDGVPLFVEGLCTRRPICTITLRAAQKVKHRVAADDER